MSRTPTVGNLWRRGDTTTTTSDSTEKATRVPIPAPSWNSSTKLLETLTDRLHEQGWGQGDAPEIPMCDHGTQELPRRPLDLGVGLWR